MDGVRRSTYERSKTYKLSSGRIECLRQSHSERALLIEQLDEKGFKVSFDFDLQEVNIVCESGKDPKDAIQFIEDRLVERELPANAFVRTDKIRQSTNIIYWRNETKNTPLRPIVSSTDGNSVHPGNKNLTDVADTKYARNAELDSVVSCEGSGYADVYPSIYNDGSDVYAHATSAAFGEADSTYPIEANLSGAGAVERTMTTFRCKGSDMMDALYTEAQAIGRKYNCHITCIHPSLRSPTEIYHPIRKTNVEVCVAAIQDVETDVIVNSTNESLNLSVGIEGVSQILLKVAGKEIQEKLYKDYPKGIQSGEVAKSGSGNMRTCKAIYHGTMPVFPPNKRDKTYKSKVAACYKALVSVILKALLMASSDGWKSVAFPALGTGNLRYPVNEVVQIMFLVVSQFFESALSPIEKVCFVIYPKAEPLLQQLFLMEKYSWQLKTVKVESTTATHRELQRDPNKKCETQFVIGKTFLQITNGDIQTAFDTSQVILILWQEKHFDTSLLQNHITKVVVDKSSWDKARLIHSYCKSDAEDVIVRAIQRGLKRIGKEDGTTVAIPVPSDGSTLWQPNVAADLILRAVQGLKRLHHIIRVSIQEENLLKPFLTAIFEKTNCRSHKVPDVFNVLDTIFPLDPCQLSVGDIEINISSDSEENNQIAAKKLKEALRINLMYMIKDK